MQRRMSHSRAVSIPSGADGEAGLGELVDDLIDGVGHVGILFAEGGEVEFFEPGFAVGGGEGGL